MRNGFLILISLALIGGAHAASLAIDSLSGPVTQNEINSFITYMQSQTPPPTPWGALNGTGHNDWADGFGGRDLEAMGEMYLVSGNTTILNLMISWSDYCVSQRNDLMSATNGGQRVMWTGLIDKVWCPNWPTDTTYNQYLYCACETEDVIGHLAFCAKLILQNPSLWQTPVPDGNPYGYGVTYFQRATNYMAKCDESNDEYFLKWFIQPGTSLIRPPTNSAWTSLNENVTANNRQMMFTSGFQRLAEAHEILGDNPARVAQYDAIVKASVGECLNGMIGFHPYTTNGQAVYNWGYYPTSTSGSEATEIHAEYDMIGVWRAFSRGAYGSSRSPLIPFANTMVNVIYLGTNTFALNVDGSGGTQGTIYSGWILPADWNPQVYDLVAGAAYAKGQYKGSADITAGILLMKNRRYLEFSVTPTPASRNVQAGAATSFTLAVSPLGGFSNVITLAVTGLPPGASGSFSSASVNPATLNVASSNVTLSISTSNTTPTGSYTLNLVGTSGGVAHTNTVALVVGSYSLSASPPSQTVSAGNSASYTISLTTNSGYSGSVALGLSGLPANASASFSPAALNGAGNSTLNVTTAVGTPAGTYTLTITGTNGTTTVTTTASVTVAGATPVWTGASLSDNNWSDSANWGGISLAPGNPLTFNGSARLNNTNDTTPAATYSNIVFTAAASAFTLNGNPITLGGNITNYSASAEAIALGLNFSGSFAFNGAGGLLILGGGLTNRLGAPGSTTLTLAGAGQLVNRLNSTTSPGGTNVILLNEATANWTLTDNSSSSGMTVPWVFQINNGAYSFGTAASAPLLTLTTPNNSPSDNQVGAAPGATAIFNMVGGTLTTSSRFNTATASNSTGIINQIGGTFNMGSQFQGANGSNPGEVSIVNVSGGSMNIGGGTGPFYVASRGAGSLTVGGSGVVNCSKLDLSRNAAGNTISSAGTVNLDGGTLMVTSVTNISANQQTGGSPTATFNFNGGTLMGKPGASTGFFQGSAVTPVTPITTIVQSGGAIIDDGGNAITIAEPLQHDASLGSDADGGLTKLNSGTLTLTTNSTFNGDTTVTAGTLALSGAAAIGNSGTITVAAGATLDASARTDGTLSLTAGQTLTGSGMVKGAVIITSGATLAPGGSLSTLSFDNNLALTDGSMTVAEVSPASAGPATTNDSAQVAGNLQYGGTLVITNISAASFSAGDTFKLFNAASYSGAFANIAPVIPAVNLAWKTNALSTGILSIVSSPTPPPKIAGTMLSGNSFVLAGSNGVPNWTYYLLASTNPALPFTQWPVVATNSFDFSGNFNFTNVLDLTMPQMFYRLKLQ